MAGTWAPSRKGLPERPQKTNEILTNRAFVGSIFAKCHKKKERAEARSPNRNLRRRSEADRRPDGGDKAFVLTAVRGARADVIPSYGEVVPSVALVVVIL